MTAVATAPAVERGAARERVVPEKIPFTRILGVELRKMFDTRTGSWLMGSIGVLAVLATTAVVLFTPDDAYTHDDFAAAIGIPMQIILPIIAILTVTSEWTQRTGLATFTLVPGRGRVIAAKLLNTVLLALVAIPTALAIGAVGNLVATGLAGIDPVWDVEAGTMALITLSTTLVMAMGFALGALFRNSAVAIVGFFVWFAVLPGLIEALATYQEWFRDIRPWMDFQYASGVLYGGAPTAEQWAQLGVSSIPWLILPFALGMWLISRSEVK